MSKKIKFVKWVERSVLTKYGETSYFCNTPDYMDDPFKVEFEVEVPEPTIVFVPDDEGTFIQANNKAMIIHQGLNIYQRYRREERYE